MRMDQRRMGEGWKKNRTEEERIGWVGKEKYSIRYMYMYVYNNIVIYNIVIYNIYVYV
jgi:hypothetical protein